MEYESSTSPSLKNKLKQTLFLSCCSTATRRETLQSHSSSSSSGEKRSLIRVSSMWIRTKGPDIPEIREKCRNIFSRIGKHHHHHHRRLSSADFRYDPLSYALNFEDGIDLDEASLKNFSARLPASPISKSVAESPVFAVSREIAAFS